MSHKACALSVCCPAQSLTRKICKTEHAKTSTQNCSSGERTGGGQAATLRGEKRLDFCLYKAVANWASWVNAEHAWSPMQHWVLCNMVF